MIHTEQKQRPGSQSSILRGLAEGCGYVRQQPALQIALALQFILAFLVFPCVTLLPVFADSIFHVGATGLGVMNATVGCGALIGAMLFLVLNQSIKKALRLLGVLCIIGGLGCLTFGFTANMTMAFPLLVILGICMVMPLAVTNTSIQMMAPPELRGRILSIRILITFGLAPFGNLVAGWIAQFIGAPSTVVMDGIFCALAALLLIGLQVKRGLELHYQQ